MILKKSLVPLFLILVVTFTNFAQPKATIGSIGDFTTEAGVVIRDCKVGYNIYGQMNEAKSNIILFPTWFAGTSDQIGFLMGPSLLIDTTHFCVIAVDALGNGVSTSPSNYPLAAPGMFPDITITDMVRSQFQLLTRVMGIKEIYGIVGGSMGGMQAFEWAVLYPGFAKKIVPYVSTPRPSSNDLLIFDTWKNIIETGRKYGAEDYEIHKLLDMTMNIVVRTPDYVVKKYSYDSASVLISGFGSKNPRTFTVDNWSTQLKAMVTHNIAKRFMGSLEKAAESVKAEMLIIVSASDHLLFPLPAVQFADLLQVDPLILISDCGHLAVNCEMEQCSARIKAFLSGQ